MQTFEIGSLVVEPFRGVCTVVACKSETMLGKAQLFYELRPSGSQSTIKIPAAQMVAQGVRPVMSEEEMSQVLGLAVSALEFPDESYGQRMDRWIANLRSGDHAGPPAILRELLVLQQRGGRLTSKENDLRESLSKSLRQEIALALNLSVAKAGVRLNQAIGVSHKDKK